MLFAAFFDVSIVPFYAFTALVAATKHDTWAIILENQDLTPIFAKVAFYLATVGGGLHLVTLAISLYLAVTFRKITKLPPDMNPLEDNLTSRHHKRNKSSISTATTLTEKEKRLSAPLETKRSSGAAYEDLSRPPTIPFFHTRTQSTDSFSTYKSTPPPSRDSRSDLPSRQYQIQSHSPRSSVADLKRQSYGTSKRGSTSTTYSEIPLHETNSPLSKQAAGWYTSDSLSKPRSKSSSPRKGNYAPLPLSDDLPNPLEANPPTPRHSQFSRPLTEISNNRASGDIADQHREEFRSRYYGDLKPATPPVMVGTRGGNRQVSGNDFAMGRRVSGKVAEEGMGGQGWGTRFRKVSGI